ncbi:MAG: M48 family metallopeptidase [Synoicihabitans sp.]
MNQESLTSASYFTGRLTAAVPVSFCRSGDHWEMRSLADGTLVASHPVAETVVSDRLAHVPRVALFPDGSSAEIEDNSRMDDWVPARAAQRFGQFIHRLESHSRIVAIATVVLVASVVAIFQVGLPWLAARVAHGLPDKIDAEIGRVSYASVEAFSQPTGLSLEERSNVHLQLERILLPDESPPTLHLRNWFWMANAFALPGNQIVVTDQLAQDLTNDELAAVLAHEMAHLEERHAEQSILLSSTVLLLVATVTGDLATLTSFAGALPVTLIQSGYSRDFERNADFRAVDRLIAVGIPGDALATALETLGNNIPDEGNAANFNYLSTHPSNSERTAAIRERAANSSTEKSNEGALPEEMTDPAEPVAD